MVINNDKPKLAVLQLSGGNDYLNTIIPYSNGLYYDNRPAVKVLEDQVLKLDNDFGLHPNMAPIKELYDAGKVAIVHGVGYPTPMNRSHFRSMDIWHTCEPDKVGTEGWLGRATRDLDPRAENVVTAVNFGRGLPRALGVKGVPVASVGNLETYGLLNDIQDQQLREYALDAFKGMYGPQEGGDAVRESLGDVGRSAMKGADILRSAPQRYSSSVEYAANPIAEKLKMVAQVMFANVGTRIYYTQHGSFDTHSSQLGTHSSLWKEISEGIFDFWADLEDHNAENDMVMLLFSEFGRRIHDNGSGTDHRQGGVAFVIGGKVKGGMYGEFPSMKSEDQVEGDVYPNLDFRGLYATLLEQWLGLDPVPIVGGQFEQLNLIKR